MEEVNEYIITAEVKLVVLAKDELEAKEEFEQSVGWLTDHFKIVRVCKIIED